MKRIFSLVLTLVLSVGLIASLSTTASAGLFDGVVTGQMQDTSGEDNGTIYWELSYDLTTASLKISGDGYMPNGTDQCWRTALGSRYITELVIEEGVRSIMEGAFYGEEQLKYVTLPSTIEYIGDSAFADTGVKFVTLPKRLREFNGTIFNSQTFTQYSVSPENPYYKAVDGVVYSKDMTKLVAYPVGRFSSGGENDFQIPETITEISSYAFLNCKHASFRIPGTVKDIQYQAFAGNTNLSSLEIENGVENIYDSAFLACNSLSAVHLPTSVNYLGYCALGFGYAFDFEGLSFMLDQLGVEHEKIDESNAAYYVTYTPYTLNEFVYCTVNDNTKIYAPKDSAGHNYCKMFGVTYKQSQAITPRLISATTVENGVEIKWSLSSDAEGYYIYRKNKSGEYIQVATVNGKENVSYTDPKAYSAYKNTYTVKAYNQNGESRYFTKGVSAYYIATPKLVSAKNSLSGIKVTWEKVTGATNYNVYRKNAGSEKWEHIAIVDKSKLSFIDKSVSNLSNYQYTVRAYDDNGISDYNKTGVGTTYVCAPSVTTFKNTSKGVNMAWKQVSGASSYRIYRKNANGSWELIKKLNDETFTYTDTDVKSGTEYTYAVKAVSSGAVSGYTAKTIEFLKKSVVTSAKSTKNGITINYSKSAGADKYNVYRRSDGETQWTRIASVKGASSLSYTDKTAQKGETYYYTVRAYSGSYKSAYDNKIGYKIKDKY